MTSRSVETAVAPPAALPALPIAAPPARNRHPYGVLLRAHGRGGVYDIVVYQDALLLSRVSGTDPVLVGALVGALLASVVGALAGAFIGEHLARNGASHRLNDLFYAAPEYVFGAHKQNRFIRASDVRFARFIEYGRRQRVLELRMHDGSKTRLTFNAQFQSNSFAPETLRVSLAPRMRTERYRFRPASIVPAVLVGTAVLLLSAVVASVVVGVFS